jgi:hypothetical protein
MFQQKRSKHELPHMVERMHAEEKFFSENFMLSYSGLSKLLSSPVLFYKHYILNEREDNTDKYTIEGNLVHTLLLKPEKFDKEFLVTPSNVPSDNPKKVLHTLFDYYKTLDHEADPRESLVEFEPEIMTLLKETNLYQSLKLDSARLEKINDEKGETYWEYLKNCEGRKVIDDVTLEIAREYVKRILSNIEVMGLMGMIEDTFNPVDHFNEIELAIFPESLPFGLRGIIDNLVFDHGEKIIKINDLKKISKDLLSFKDSVIFWKYWVQAGMYNKLVTETYLNRPEYADYTIEFRFIVLDSYMQIGIYEVSKETMDHWIIDTNKELDKAAFHFENRNFELPYEFLTNGKITL